MNEAAVAVDVKDLFAAKVRAGIFAPVARHLREDLAQDRLAEGVALTFQMYAKSVAEGAPMDDALLVHACHLRAIDLGRRVAGAQGARSKADVFDERNYKEGRVEVLRFDEIDDSEDPGWAEVMANKECRCRESIGARFKGKALTRGAPSRIAASRSTIPRVGPILWARAR
jgi:hypothetical protein